MPPRLIATRVTARPPSVRPGALPVAPGLVWFPVAEPPDELVLDGATHARIESLVRELNQTQRFLAAELDPPTRLLFTGPPGTGKTLTARWIAFRAGLPLGLVRIDGVVGRFCGQTGQTLAKVFAAIGLQRCVLFLDEIDAIGGKRGDASSGGSREMNRQMLGLLQAIDALPVDYVVMGATNRVDHVDAALRSRLSERVDFKLPTADARKRMVERWLRSAPVTTEAQAELVRATKGRSGRTVRARAMRLGRAAILNQDREAGR